MTAKTYSNIKTSVAFFGIVFPILTLLLIEAFSCDEILPQIIISVSTLSSVFAYFSAINAFPNNDSLKTGFIVAFSIPMINLILVAFLSVGFIVYLMVSADELLKRKLIKA